MRFGALCETRSPVGLAPRKSARGLICLVLAWVVMIPDWAKAQEREQPTWQLYVTPYLWISGISGTTQASNRRLPEQTVSASFGSILSHLNSVPVMGSAELRHGRFGILTDIMAISVKTDVSSDKVLFSGGSARLTQVIGTAIGAYRVLEADNQFADLGIGVRAFGASTSFTVNSGALPGFTGTPGASWADPIVAIRYKINLGTRWGLTGYGDIGGGPSSEFTWQLLATVDYRLSDDMVLRLGYRHLQFQRSGDSLRQNMGMSGPILGSTLRF